MLAGHLQEKDGKYYAVLNCKHRDDSRFPKWVSTGLPVRGNKKKAEKMLDDFRRAYSIFGEPLNESDYELNTTSELPSNVLSEVEASTETEPQPSIGNMNDDGVLFSDYMLSWLSYIETEVDPVTFSGYCYSVESVIVPYFRKTGVKLNALTSKDLKDFYKSERLGDPEHQIRPKKGTTVVHYHSNIHKALETAVADDIVGRNVAHKIRPSTDKFIGSFYLADEALELINAAKDTKLNLAVMFGLFYGLRRSEIVGLKWQNFDLVNNLFTIAHTVTSFKRDGKMVRYAKDKTKNQSSLRSLPLIPLFQVMMKALREKQKEDRRLCGNCYNKQYQDYVYVDDVGKLMNPDYISAMFPKLLEKHGLRHIRFHDTRHSCASLLLRNGVSMKEIQEWLGHSDYSTTANLYAHLEVEASKLRSAQLLTSGLGFCEIEYDINEAESSA